MSLPPAATLLVVDSDPETAAMVRTTLSEYQKGRFVVHGASDAETAVAAVEREGPPDLALVYHRMEGVDGLRAVAALRGRAPGVRVILVTDQRDFGALLHAMRLQVDDHIVREEAKASALPRIIAATLERSALTREIAERRRTELIARRKADAVRELIVTVCHEFNNPLAAIKISTDILGRQALTAADRELVAALDDQIRRIEAEINRLRSVGAEETAPHSGAGQSPPEPGAA
jgi:CheY-like chemotaxis protein